jgi:hypothetical protein
LTSTFDPNRPRHRPTQNNSPRQGFPGISCLAGHFPTSTGTRIGHSLIRAESGIRASRKHTKPLSGNNGTRVCSSTYLIHFGLCPGRAILWRGYPGWQPAYTSCFSLRPAKSRTAGTPHRCDLPSIWAAAHSHQRSALSVAPTPQIHSRTRSTPAVPICALFSPASLSLRLALPLRCTLPLYWPEAGP